MGRYIQNPTLEDVETWVDKNGPNPKYYKLKAGEVKKFKNFVADLLVTKLANRMLFSNYPSDKNRYRRIKELKAIIEMKHEITKTKNIT